MSMYACKMGLFWNHYKEMYIMSERGSWNLFVRFGLLPLLVRAKAISNEETIYHVNKMRTNNLIYQTNNFLC